MTDDDLFVDIGNRHRGRVKCTVCGKPGYAGGSWQDQCRAGHPFVCSCGRRFYSKAGLSSHRRNFPPNTHADTSEG